MVDFGYLFDMCIQMLVIDFIPKVKTSPQRGFYRNTAIGRRILYRKTGWPNAVLWPEYARKYGIHRANDRTKYFTKKEFLLSGDPEKIAYAQERIKTQRRFYL
jgi:hypothetical protein